MGSILLMGAGLQTTVTGPTYDPDAQLFFNAQTGAGVTLTTTQMNAVNQWVVDSKAANIWTKFKAIYPFVGSTATSQKFNLKNPLDTNAAFRLSFIGGGTHSANGYQPNGINSYANTFLNSGVDLTNTNNHISYYSRTATVGVVVEMGTYDGATSSFFQVRTAANYISGNVSNAISYTTTGSALGFWLGTKRSNTDREVYRNGVSETTNTTSDSLALPNILIYLGARNSVNYIPPGAQLFSSKELAFSTIGDGLTDLESQLFYQITEKYQVALSRNINTTQSFYYNSAYNNETNAFLFSTQITNATIQTATNTLVADLKTAGVFTKMKALYPMVGGTATTCKFNLINPQDSDAAYRLNFVGGWTPSANGMTPNGVNAYANTFLSSSIMALNSGHLSYYSRTNNTSNGVEIGALRPSPDSYSDLSLRNSNQTYFRFNNSATYNQITAVNTDGYFIGTRTAVNIIKTFKNGSIIINGTALSSSTSPITFFLAAHNNNGTAITFSNRQCALSSIGDGLTDAEALALYNAVNAFQITLARNV